MDIYAVILAAGKGTRMKSLDQSHAKVSHPILGVPLISYVLRSLVAVKPFAIYAVIGFGGEATTKFVEGFAIPVWQHEQKGTGHAVQQVAPFLSGKEGITLVLCGDTPLLTGETLAQLIEEHRHNANDLTILSVLLDNPKGYGRLVRDLKGSVKKIVEQVDASLDEQGIHEVNTGVYVFNNKLLFENLVNLTSANKQNELYLTDVVKLFKEAHLRVGASILKDNREMLGINDRVQLAEATKIMKNRINEALMLSGVTLEDPENTYIGPDVVIGPDTIIKPGCYIMGKTIIGSGNTIGPDTYLENMKIGNSNSIVKSYLVDSTLGNDDHVGPFAHLRGHCEIGNAIKIGNFVEMKNAKLHDGVKSAHLTYVGDSEVGENTNIGCGTITANYDGKNKHHTEIGKNVFVGSGSTLIAPIKIADNAFIAAGSTLNQDVAEDDLAIARARQVNKPGYAKIIRSRK